MKKIKIIAIPDGDEDIEIRKSWFNLKIPLVEDRIQPSIDHSGKTVYSVYALTAFDCLKKANPKAYEYYHKNAKHLFEFGQIINFDQDKCEYLGRY